jgi:hypothetical protein
MDMMYVFPTCVGVVATAAVIIMARRGQHSLLASALAGGAAGAIAWYVALFATVVIMIPVGAHG